MRDEETAIIIPVYNEGPVIAEVVNQALKKYGTVICVNDGSSDDSSKKIKKTGAYLVEHPINMGQGAALQTGIEFARQFDKLNYFVTFDGDGQHRLEDVEKMLQELKNGGYDIVLGSRFLGKAEGIKGSKKLLLKAAIRFSNSTSGIRLTDTHNGLRAFSRKVAKELQITAPDMSHASEILEVIAERKYKYKEVPVSIIYTSYSLAKGQSIINMVNIAFDAMLRKILR